MTNQRNFNGQYFNTYEEEKGLNKTNSKQRYAKMQKHRYINQMKFKNIFFVLYVTCSQISRMLKVFTCTLHARLRTCM